MPNNEQKIISTPIGIVILVLFALLLGGGTLAYQYHVNTKDVLLNQIVEACRINTPKKDSTVDLSKGWRKFIDADFGFAFYYPKNWEVSIKNDKIFLSNYGPYKDDEIIIEKIVGDIIKDSDAKFGNVSYYFDKTEQKWMSDINTDFNSGIQVATPDFYTNSNYPVFNGVGRWETNIVPLSHNKFLKIKIGGGSGFTLVLDPFVKTISKIESDSSREEIDMLVADIINSESAK